MAQIRSWVEESLKTMRENPFASDQVKAAMQMRWSQRESILLGIENYVANLENERQALIEETTKRSVPPYAEQD